MRGVIVGLSLGVLGLNGAALAAQASGAAAAPAPALTSVAPVIIGERMRFRSALQGEEYPVMVHLPDSYGRTTHAYPVLYVLDGEAHFHHATGVAAFLAQQQRIPEMIVVGIGNTNRTRDLTPPTDDAGMRANGAGGADRFLRAIGEELIPEIERRYRTLHYRVLAGHSFGGLFALHALTTRPEIFQSYVVISPSTWWNRQSLVNGVPAFLAAHRDLRASLYITTGDEGGEMLASAQRLAGILERNAPETVEWTFRHMPAESHGSIPHRTLYDGLETIFADLRIELDTTSRSVADLERRYERLSAKYGYDIPVTEPVINRLGYGLLGRGLHADAIAVFTENTRRFPKSANTYDSLGDAYEAAGELEPARRAFARAVELARENNDPVLQVSAQKLTSVSSKLGTSTQN
ncbi:MAG TPA: alpha/beta hydrolase-fold protein [Gemmatimonadales bacterium]